MLLPLKRYFQISGRSRRMEYWMFYLFTILVGVAATMADRVIGVGALWSSGFDWGVYAHWTVDGPFSTAASLFFFIPGITVAVRRLHDIDRSGWWLLLIFVPVLGWILLLIFMLLDGTQGTNRFGPDPKEPTDRQDVDEIFS
ncbi:DUF805 domain-containing protein [Stakelama marina]